jgi:hypothetical protein
MEDQRLILKQTPEQVRELVNLHLERSKFWAEFAHAANTFARSQKRMAIARKHMQEVETLQKNIF